MYAILDIETTGGKYNEEGITEIAIYKFDGHEILDQFCSLVNPEKKIQPFVVNLTGINNKMLYNAPKFYEVAKRIIEITEGCILVAHNAQFDNRILTTEFDRLGYSFEKAILCTVELSKKLIPDLPSYSLGKLVRSLGIPIADRHRAQGDAKATVELFKLLLEKDTKKEIISSIVRKNSKRQLEPKLLEIIETLPTSKYTAYSQNKGEKLAFCLNATKDNPEQLIDLNTLTFVALHELAHVATKSVGHTPEFWDNFKFLLIQAEKINIYNPMDYKNNPKNYCGMTITDNPYFN